MSASIGQRDKSTPIASALEAVSVRLSAATLTLTPIIGRARELDEVVALLEQGASILTLVGPGGVGKTRIAQELITSTRARFPGGVAFVSIAAIFDPSSVVEAILSQVPWLVELVAGTGDRSVDAVQPCLIVVDNFEQVVAAAPSIVELVRTVPELRVVVTSRTRLNVRGEQVYPVLPFELPAADRSQSAESIAANPAVRLFLERARLISPSFMVSAENAQHVAEICRRLDGLPLALELAAARIAALSPQEIVARLDQRLPMLTGGGRDAPVRLQTMRDAIAWSDHLLDERHRVAFHQVSVFAGSFSLDAAESILHDPEEGPPGADGHTVLDAVETLISNSLVRRDVTEGEARFSMLETIREYARDMLRESGQEAAVQNRHARYFLDLAERGNLQLKSASGGVWMARLAADAENIRAAFAWFRQTKQGPEALRLAGSMAQCWDYRGRLDEGRSWLEYAMSVTNADELSDGRARAHAWLGWLLARQGDPEAARTHVDTARTIWEALGDHVRAAFTVNALGSVSALSDDDARSIEHHQRALALFDALDAHSGIADATVSLSDAAFRQHDVPRALELARQTVAVSEAHDLPFYRAVGHVAMSQAQLASGDERGALLSAEKALDIAAELGFDACLADAMVNVAAVSITAEGVTAGARLLGAAKTLLASTGATRFLFETQFQRALARAREASPGGAVDRAWSEGIRMGRESAIVATRAMLHPDPPGRGRATKALSPQEIRVLRLLAEGHSDKEIAATLSITFRTVNAYVASILTKLDAPSRTAAAIYAVRQGIV